MIDLIFAVTCQYTIEYQKIIEIKPAINREYACQLSSSIRKHSKAYKIPSQVMIGIAATESSFRLGAVNSRSNDYGVFQVNKYNIKAYKLDKFRLLNDLDYSVESGFKIFNWFYKRYPLDIAIKRYNCGTAKNCVNWSSVDGYLNKVKSYMF